MFYLSMLPVSSVLLRLTWAICHGRSSPDLNASNSNLNVQMPSGSWQKTNYSHISKVLVTLLVWSFLCTFFSYWNVSRSWLIVKYWVASMTLTLNYIGFAQSFHIHCWPLHQIALALPKVHMALIAPSNSTWKMSYYMSRRVSKKG